MSVFHFIVSAFITAAMSHKKTKSLSQLILTVVPKQNRQAVNVSGMTDDKCIPQSYITLTHIRRVGHHNIISLMMLIRIIKLN